MSGGNNNLAGVVRAKEERKSRDLVMTGEGREGDGFFLVCWNRYG